MESRRKGKEKAVLRTRTLLQLTAAGQYCWSKSIISNWDMFERSPDYQNANLQFRGTGMTETMKRYTCIPRPPAVRCKRGGTRMRKAMAEARLSSTGVSHIESHSACRPVSVAKQRRDVPERLAVIGSVSGKSVGLGAVQRFLSSLLARGGTAEGSATS